MKITRLRNKLLLSAVGISLGVTLASMLAVAWVVSRQYLAQSETMMHKASAIINDNINGRKSDLLDASRQVASQKNLGATIWYLAQYAHSNLDREILLNTYQQLARDTYKIGRVAKLSRVAIYDAAGNLVSFALFDRSGEKFGFVERFPTPVFQVATLKSNEDLNKKSLQATHSVAGIGLGYDGQLPHQEEMRYAVIDGSLELESDAPIMGEAFDPNSGKRKIQQLGLVVVMQPLDQSFVDELSRLTGLKINVFSQEGFSNGDVAAYRNPDWANTEKASTTSLNEITIDGAGYYQSLIPLYANDHLAGAVAALQSKEVVLKNIHEMMQTLWLIAAGSLLLILPFAWYFASAIAQPLTVLSRIFRGVASGIQTVTLHGEFIQLERAKKRQDELGDLTQSFIAMNVAVNQKIQQINEINASLEHKVEERTAALAASEQESRTLIENSPDTIARYDRECRRTYVNPAFGALAEGGVAALLGKKPSECPGGPNAAIYEAKIGEVFANGQNIQFELKWSGKDGKEICSHIRLTAERDLSGNITSILGIGRDITELNESRSELNRKEMAKTRFLAAAGHDLRQPLAAANLFIDALKFTDPSSDQEQIIQRLDQTMSNFNELLDALLNVSRLDSGIIKPEFTAIPARGIFDWIEESFAPLAAEKHLRLKLHFPASKALVVYSDTGLLKSVLQNLISNAIKYTLKGGVLISARQRADSVLFQVWDTGIGITDEQTGKIFDEFYQVDNAQRDRTQGLGLGLSIAKRALALVSGEITCRSRLGSGSVFEFRLPVDNSSYDAVPDTSTSVSPGLENSRSFVRGKRFIVVEDDAMVQEGLSKTLKLMGGQVESFGSAESALQHPDIGNADCYIVDYMLPGEVDGVNFLLGLRQKLHRPVCAVMMSGNTSSYFIRKVELFDWPVLHKPVNMEKLISKLSHEHSRIVGLATSGQAQ